MPVTNHDRATEIYNAASILSTGFLILTAGHWGKNKLGYVNSFVMLDFQWTPPCTGTALQTYFGNEPRCHRARKGFTCKEKKIPIRLLNLNSTGRAEYPEFSPITTSVAVFKRAPSFRTQNFQRGFGFLQTTWNFKVKSPTCHEENKKINRWHIEEFFHNKHCTTLISGIRMPQKIKVLIEYIFSRLSCTSK